MVDLLWLFGFGWALDCGFGVALRFVVSICGLAVAVLIGYCLLWLFGYRCGLCLVFKRLLVCWYWLLGFDFGLFCWVGSWGAALVCWFLFCAIVVCCLGGCV